MAYIIGSFYKNGKSSYEALDSSKYIYGLQNTALSIYELIQNEKSKNNFIKTL